MAATPKRRMTATEAVKFIGQRGTFHDCHRTGQVEEVYWEVEVLDVRMGTSVHLLLRPVHGSGRFWTMANRVTLKKK